MMGQEQAFRPLLEALELRYRFILRWGSESHFLVLSRLAHTMLPAEIVEGRASPKENGGQATAVRTPSLGSCVEPTGR